MFCQIDEDDFSFAHVWAVEVADLLGPVQLSKQQ